MAEGMRLVSVRRGVDPRRFALFAFGGAAGLHATDIARQLGLARVVVPRVAAVLSAWGMLATDLRFEVSRTPYRRRRRARRRRRQAAVRGDGGGRHAPAARLASPGRRVPRARSTCATASRCSRSPCRSTTSTGPSADPLPQIVERFHRRHEAALHLRDARPGKRAGQRPRHASPACSKRCRASRACRRPRRPRREGERRI